MASLRGRGAAERCRRRRRNGGRGRWSVVAYRSRAQKRGLAIRSCGGSAGRGKETFVVSKLKLKPPSYSRCSGRALTGVRSVLALRAMSTTKDANKENDGTAAAPPLPHKHVDIFSTDMTEDMRQALIAVAIKAFHAPVNHGKVYQTIADIIRTECEKECDAEAAPGGNEAAGGAGSGSGGAAVGSGGWSCVVGGEHCGCTAMDLRQDHPQWQTHEDHSKSHVIALPPQAPLVLP